MNYFNFTHSDRPQLPKNATTIATLFSGGGILDIGAKHAGLEPIWGVEYDENICQWYERNLGHSLICDRVENVDYSKLFKPDILHASPVCKNYSQANTKKESTEDKVTGLTVARAIFSLTPKVFTLENVPAYRKSKSYKVIRDRLTALNYVLSESIICMDNYGVPQSRKRFIVVAVKRNLCDRFGSFTGLIPVHPVNLVSWYDAIADLIPTFQPSKLTNTQTSKLNPLNLLELDYLLLKRNQIRDKTPCRATYRPAWTVTAGLATDGKGGNRKYFADIFHPSTKDTKTLTTRALARLQSIPDWYELPEANGLAGTIIGNGVPSYFTYQLYSQVKNQYFDGYEV